MSADRERHVLANVLFAWNTPDDPFFVIQGRAGEASEEDPYMHIADAVLSSDWLARVKREAAAEALEEAAADSSIADIGRDVREYGELGTPYSNGARHASAHVREAIRARAASIRKGPRS